jgi:hypothetical protein
MCEGPTGPNQQRLERTPTMITIPEDFHVRPLGPTEMPDGRTTCGTCGTSWDDDICTSSTPAPSARCPFEFFHEDEDAALNAAAAFVDWINTEADGPARYRWTLSKPGRKFVRIVMETTPDAEFTGASVHAFVNLANGDLLKAAGWKAPAKGARGNLLTDLEGVKARFDWTGGYLYAR